MQLFRFPLFLILLLVIAVSSLDAQTKKPKKMRVLFIFDASNSMKGMIDGQPKMESAKVLFNKFIDSLAKKKNYEFALRMYGSTVAYPPGDCNDSKLIVPFAKGNVAAIKQKVNAAKPTGITPIEHSLTMSADDFPDQMAENVVILITDGIEECGGDPCSAKAKLEEKGIIIRPCIIGIGLTEQQAETFNCVGTYISGEDPNPWKQVNQFVVEIEKSKTSAQINLLDISARPTETSVNISIFDQKSGNMLFNYVHSLNSKGLPDTIHTLQPGRTYKMIVHSIPSVEKKNILLNDGKHNIIPIDCPQGNIFIMWKKKKNPMLKLPEKMRAVIRKGGELQTLHVQNLDTKEKYIVGNYDLEVLTLPRTMIKDVKVNQGQIKYIEIDRPGRVQIVLKEAGNGSILKEEDGKLIHVINLDTKKTVQEFHLQPGNYRVTYRAATQKQTIFTIEKKFSVSSEKDYVIDLTNH